MSQINVLKNVCNGLIQTHFHAIFPSFLERFEGNTTANVSLNVFFCDVHGRDQAGQFRG